MPRMTIRSRLPWPLRLLITGILFGLAGVAAIWVYQQGRALAGYGPVASPQQVAALEQKVAELTGERDRFSAIANAAESQINMERAAQSQLAQQVKELLDENTKLKEDLAFFERLLPANGGSRGMAIRRLETELLGANQLRYRLLVMKGGKGGKDFVGDLQLAVVVTKEGSSDDAIIVFPQGNGADKSRFQLNFKHYQRVEGVLTLPDGARAKSVQARILENGQIRVQHTANL